VRSDLRRAGGSHPPGGALLALVALGTLVVAGCDGADAGEGPAEGTSDLSASLLDAGGAAQSTAGSGRAPAAGGSLDLDELGFESGDEDAPVQIVEFSDFGCGYCARFHNEVFPTLEREYIATGKVVWKYVPMILGIFGANAELAAEAGECAGEQDRFPAMRDRLFSDQAAWKRAGDPRSVFDDFARSEGLDEDRFAACLDDGRREARVAAGTDLSRRAGVRGTPTFFVVGYGSVPGMLPLEVFRELLDTVYAERTAAGADG
jgi:protein-disulfide isomerase